jgi:hypothetical protein
LVGDTVQLAVAGRVIKVHPIRHDRAKEHGAFATPNGGHDARALLSLRACFKSHSHSLIAAMFTVAR